MQEENTNIKKLFPMNEEILKKLGYNSIALEMLLKRESQIDPRDIIMPGEDRSSIQQDYSNVEIVLENLKSQIIQILNTAKSLPQFLEGEEGPDDSAFYDYRRSLVDSLEEAGNKISTLLIENNQFESANDLDNSLQQ
jgi:hypothetical protein